MDQPIDVRMDGLRMVGWRYEWMDGLTGGQLENYKGKDS